MQKICGILAIIMITFLFSGCSLEVPSPDSLIIAPLDSQEKVNLKQKISDWLDNDEYLTTPLEMDNKMSYTLLNIDRDSEDELVAFIKKDSGYELGFAIFDVDENDELQLDEKVILSGTSVDYFKVVDLNGTDKLKELLFGVNVGGVKYLYVYQYADGTLNLIGDKLQYDILTLGSLTNDNSKQIVTAIRSTTSEDYNSTIKLYELADGFIRCTDYNVFEGYCKELVYTKVSEQKCGLYATMLYNYQMTNVMVLLLEDEHLVAKAQNLLEDDYASMNNNQLFSDVNSDGITDILSFKLPIKNDTNTSYENYLRIWQCWDGKEGFRTVKAAIGNQQEGYTFDVPLEWLADLGYGFEYQGEIEWVVFYYRAENSYISMFSIASVDLSVWENFTELHDSAIFLGNNPTNDKVYISFIANNLPAGFNINEDMLIACLSIDGGKENGR